MPQNPDLWPTRFRAAATCEQLCKTLIALRADLKPAPTIPPPALVLRTRQLIGASRKLLGRDASARPLAAITLAPPVRRAELLAALIHVEKALALFRAPRFGPHRWLKLPAWCLHDDDSGTLARKLIDAPPGSKEARALAAADAYGQEMRARLADRIDRHVGDDLEKLDKLIKAFAAYDAERRALKQTYPRRRRPD